MFSLKTLWECGHISSVWEKTVNVTRVSTFAGKSLSLVTHRSIFRPFQATHGGDSFNSMLSNLERYHQQRLQARNRQLDRYIRNPTLQRLHRYRRRTEAQRSRQIISDGPLVTEDMLIQNTPETLDTSTPTRTTAALDDSIVVVNEVRMYVT